MQANATGARAVTFKSLPDGEFLPALYRSLEGSLLELEILPEFTPLRGDLLEVQSSATVYLGKVEFVQATVIGIRCEHFVDVQLLRDIRRRWSLREDSVGGASSIDSTVARLP